MVAGADACSCKPCGTVCRGKFNGCPAVWARGPAGALAVRSVDPQVFADASPSGRLVADLPAPDFSLGTHRPLAEPVPTPPPIVIDKPTPTAVVAVAPVAPVAVVAPPPWRARPVRVLAPHPKITRSHNPPAGLAGVRDRLDGLRGELKSLGDSLGRRRSQSAPEPGDWA